MILITGVAGFIGANLARKLVDNGQYVIGIDNLSRGSIENIKELQMRDAFTFIKLDISSEEELSRIDEFGDKTSEIWHLAANSDINAGSENPKIDLKDTFLTTFNLLNYAKKYRIEKFVFASSSAVYGDHGDRILDELTSPLAPISNYGAMKLASEAIISAASEKFLKKSIVFRFPNVIGTPATHGVIYDFVLKLHQTQDRLDVLGDGSQKKAYLYIDDLIAGMTTLACEANAGVQTFNLGPIDRGISVKDIAEYVCMQINPNATIVYGEGNKGWVGDVPKFSYDCKKAYSLGFQPKNSSREAVERTVDEVILQLGVSK